MHDDKDDGVSSQLMSGKMVTVKYCTASCKLKTVSQVGPFSDSETVSPHLRRTVHYYQMMCP